jgi:anti-sigma factor RsiW
MKPIDDEKLSGLLDGELPPGEAEQLRRAIAGDEELGRQFALLQSLDGELKAVGESAAVQPRVRIPMKASDAPLSLPWMILAAMILRIALKVVPQPMSCLLGAAVLAFLVSWGLSKLIEATERNRTRGSTRRLLLASD